MTETKGYKCLTCTCALITSATVSAFDTECFNKLILNIANLESFLYLNVVYLLYLYTNISKEKNLKHQN